MRGERVLIFSHQAAYQCRSFPAWCYRALRACGFVRVASGHHPRLENQSWGYSVGLLLELVCTFPIIPAATETFKTGKIRGKSYHHRENPVMSFESTNPHRLPTRTAPFPIGRGAGKGRRHKSSGGKGAALGLPRSLIRPRPTMGDMRLSRQSCTQTFNS